MEVFVLSLKLTLKSKMNRKRRRFLPDVSVLEARELLSVSVTQIGQYGTDGPDGLPAPYVKVVDDNPNVVGSMTWDWGDGNPNFNPSQSFTTFQFSGVPEPFIYISNQTHNYAPNGLYTIKIHVSDSSGASVDGTISVDTHVQPKTPATLIFDGQDPPAPGTSIPDVIGDKFTVTPIAASGKTIATVDWKFTNIDNAVPDVIQSQTVTQLHGFENTPYGVNGEEDGVAPTSLTAYWGPWDGTETVLATLHNTDGTTDVVSQNVSLAAPVASLTPTHLGTANLITSSFSGDRIRAGSVDDLGLEWKAEVAPANGIAFNFGTVQTLDQENVETIYNTIFGHIYFRQYFRDPITGADLSPFLDNDPNSTSSVFYDSLVGTSGTAETTSDTPSLGFEPASWIHPFGVLFAGVDEKFTDTLMVQPTSGQVGPGIYVPVGSESWSWAAYWDVLTPRRLADANNVSITVAYSGTTTFPTWNAIGSGYTDPQNPIHYDVQLA